jgi:hypothetical protein
MYFHILNQESMVFSTPVPEITDSQHHYKRIFSWFYEDWSSSVRRMDINLFMLLNIKHDFHTAAFVTLKTAQRNDL